MGFGADVQTKKERNQGALFSQLQPEDLLKFGMIPEFVGRIPIVVTLEALTEEALVNILTKPKNALTKQYKKLFELDGVELQFEEDAVEEIAKQAIERNTGARGLRSIIESIMMDAMFEVPSEEDVQTCVVTKDTIKLAQQPKFIRKPAQQQLPASGE